MGVEVGKHTVSRRLRRSLFLVILLLALMLSACETSAPAANPLLPEHYTVDPLFREFYEMLGGEATLGPAISPLFEYRYFKYQYTVAALMVYDPQAPGGQYFSLAALGLDLGISEPAVPRPDGPEVRYVEGHVISPLFVSIYEKLGGARYVGAPITEVHYNPEKRRYEQHFANLGFYWMEGTSLDEVHLLAYGAWKCDAYCRSPRLGASTVVVPARVDARFAEVVTRLGADFTGFALTPAYETPDGFVEQVFENVVLVMDPQQPRRIFLRAVTERLGYLPEAPVSASADPDMVFVPLQGKRGYNVHRRLMDYLAQHGGMELSGPPIGELAHFKGSIFRQCFTNLCLEVFLDFAGRITVRPAPLGYLYRLLPLQGVGNASDSAGVYPTEPPQVVLPLEAPSPIEKTPTPKPKEITLQVWETYPMVGPDQSQEIGVSVMADNVPVINAEPELLLYLPDNSTQRYYMYPTGDDGQTRQQIEGLSVPPGTLIPYQVCLYSLEGQKFCVQDSFLVWQNP